MAALSLALGLGGLLRARSVFVLPQPLRQLMEQQASAHGLPPQLLAGVIFTESRFREQAVSSAGAVGLMQLTPDTFDWLRYRAADEYEYDELALTRPEVNIRYGSYNLALLLEEYTHLETALAAYNAGRGRVNGWLKDPDHSEDGETLYDIPYPETAEYVKRVQRYTKVYYLLYYLF